MSITIHILPWLLSAMMSDLSQTADFTNRGMVEGNPIARPFVQSRSQEGELLLGIVGAGLAFNQSPTIKRIQPIWAGLHTLAVIHNHEKTGAKIPMILFPTIEVKW